MILYDIAFIAGLNTINAFIMNNYPTNYLLLFVGNLAVLYSYDHFTKKRVDNNVFSDI